VQFSKPPYDKEHLNFSFLLQGHRKLLQTGWAIAHPTNLTPSPLYYSIRRTIVHCLKMFVFHSQAVGWINATSSPIKLSYFQTLVFLMLWFLPCPINTPPAGTLYHYPHPKYINPGPSLPA